MTPAPPTVITVSGGSPYDVVVGRALASDHLSKLLDGSARCAIITSESLQSLAKPMVESVAAAGLEPTVVVIPDGERAKGIAVAESIWGRLGEVNITRSDVIVAVGGGAVTDVGGYSAAAWLRGVRWIAVPTTLLGMVDAAVGGKTGVNTEAGKNLVGAFHPPAGVLVDLDLLDTLPVDEWVNGLAEVIKAGFIADPVILDLIEADPVAAAVPDTAIRRELIERSIAVKAKVVSADLREAGLREMLNYGHTLGHAIERRERYQLPHGHGVSIGMRFASELAHRAGLIDVELVERHTKILAAVGLPTTYDAVAWAELLDLMAHDKKARGSTLRFVVLNGLADPGILAGPTDELLTDAYMSAVATGVAA